MREAENMGGKHGASFVTLNTMDWEALPFYQKLDIQLNLLERDMKKSQRCLC